MDKRRGFDPELWDSDPQVFSQATNSSSDVLYCVLWIEDACHPPIQDSSSAKLETQCHDA